MRKKHIALAMVPAFVVIGPLVATLVEVLGRTHGLAEHQAEVLGTWAFGVVALITCLAMWWLGKKEGG